MEYLLLIVFCLILESLPQLIWCFPGNIKEMWWPAVIVPKKLRSICSETKRLPVIVKVDEVAVVYLDRPAV